MNRLDEIRAAERIFVDTDCLLKLAASQLWEPLMLALNIARASLRVSDEPAMKLQRDRRLRDKLSPAGYRRAVDAEAKIARIESWSQPDLNVLLNVIDAGEALLVAACEPHEKFYILSADKRWPMHLWNEDSPAIEQIKLRIRQRCLCFEQLLLFLLENEARIVPYQTVLDNLWAIEDCWNSASKYFRAERATLKLDAIAALEAEIQLLRQGNGVLLMPNLPRL